MPFFSTAPLPRIDACEMVAQLERLQEEMRLAQLGYGVVIGPHDETLPAIAPEVAALGQVKPDWPSNEQESWPFSMLTQQEAIPDAIEVYIKVKRLSVEEEGSIPAISMDDVTKLVASGFSYTGQVPYSAKPSFDSGEPDMKVHTGRVLTMEQRAKELDLVTRPVVTESVPLQFDPDDYPLF